MLPGGRIYLSGTILLKSNITFELGNGATLKASSNREDFRALGSLLFARDAANISICGTGKIDGNFHAYLTDLQEGGYKVTAPFLGP